MCSLHTIGALALLLAAQAVHADPCKVTIEGNDNMQFSLRQIAVPVTCAEVEVTLKHSGKMTAKVMGHDWVLAKESDVSAIVNGGLSAVISVLRSSCFPPLPSGERGEELAASVNSHKQIHYS